jgi:hypothetical protein
VTSEIVERGALVKKRGLSAPLFKMLQCARDYAGIPDVRTLTIDEIDVFYQPLIPELLKATKRG